MKSLYVSPAPASLTPQGLAGKTALITGASRGVGAAAAVYLASCGCSVVINYREKASRAEAVAAEIEQAGGSAFLVQADLTNSSEVDRSIACIKGEFGSLDAVILNASGGLEREAEPGYSMRLNRDAQVNLLQKTVPILKQGSTCTFVTSHWAHFHGERAVMPAYEVVAEGKKAGETAIREMMPALNAAGIRLLVVSGGLIEGTITPRLLKRMDPIGTTQRQQEMDRQPTVQEFAKIVADATFYPDFSAGLVVFVGEPH